MPGVAQDTLENFWKTQNSGDDTKLVDLFTDDAVVEDPQWGRMEGKTAIAKFMTTMVEEMSKREIHFEALEIVGDEHLAWTRWAIVAPEGKRNGVGIYKVEGGKLSYYRDYYNPSEALS